MGSRRNSSGLLLFHSEPISSSSSSEALSSGLRLKFSVRLLISPKKRLNQKIFNQNSEKSSYDTEVPISITVPSRGQTRSHSPNFMGLGIGSQKFKGSHSFKGSHPSILSKRRETESPLPGPTSRRGSKQVNIISPKDTDANMARRKSFQQSGSQDRIISVIKTFIVNRSSFILKF